MSNIKSSFIQTVSFFAALFLIGLTACVDNPKSKNRDVKPRSADPGWVQLFDGETLDGWVVANFVLPGTVEVVDGAIQLEMGDGCTGVTWGDDFPKMEYEVKLEAKKLSGNDFFCGITFPVGDSFCSLIVGGWGGPVVGLSNIDGYDASENETSSLKKFEPDSWYTIHLKVSSDKIEAWIDGEQVINLDTRGKQLSIRSDVAPSKPFGICSWRTSSTLRNIRLKK